MNDETKNADNEYLKHFPIEAGKRKAALDRAWSNRDFEINLFWKRATYFWAFITLSYTGYFTTFPLNNFLVRATMACMCISLSFIWVFVQFGSKRWQENWESHIDMLEDDSEGPIYKYVQEYRINFSVSKLNQAVSILNVLFSISLLCYAFLEKEKISLLEMALPIIFLLIFLGLTLLFARTGNKNKKTKFHLRTNDLE